MINIKENERLDKLNHSCAHLLAQAVQHLYPQAKNPHSQSSDVCERKDHGDFPYRIHGDEINLFVTRCCGNFF